jgi:AcrR family transcriptional regulator
MTNRRPELHATHGKVLDAACLLFAEKGYQGTTVALICRKAGANIAAVNYHFGGKQRLYRAAWRHAHEQFVARVPPDGGVGPDRPAAERLRGRIRAGLRSALGGEAVGFRIMRHEMANPTGLLRRVIDDAIAPLRRATQALIRELLGPHATQRDIELCEVCTVAPWMHVMHHRQAQKYAGLAPIFPEAMLDTMADHFADFALAGIAALGRRIEHTARRRPPRPSRRARR